MAASSRRIRLKLRDFALSLPEATEALPWGERVAKVKKKVFAFLGRDMDPRLGLGVKLLRSHASALALPAAKPMGYGLGKSGWVSAKFEATDEPSFELLRDWITESYCAVAPKALAAQVAAESASKTAARKASTKQASTKKTPCESAKQASAKNTPSGSAKKPAGRSKSVARRRSGATRASKP
jgi:predicted DNA-binding protein (MmcQ/YjbR family)